MFVLCEIIIKKKHIVLFLGGGVIQVVDGIRLSQFLEQT